MAGVRVRVRVRVRIRVRVSVSVRVGVWGRAILSTHTCMHACKVGLSGMRFSEGGQRKGGGILPMTSHSIFYSRVGQIAIFSHCQP